MPLRVVVFGAGAMGSFIGAKLSKRAEVTLIGRPAHVAAIRKRGLRVGGLTRGTFRLAATSDPSELKGADLVILTTKAYDTPSAAKTMARLAVRSPVLSLQNGLTNIPVLAVSLPRVALLGGTTTHGVTFVGPGHVRHAGRGATVIGAARGSEAQAGAVARLFESADLPCEVVSDVKALLWRKAVVNAAVNPITAWLRVQNGKLLEDAGSRLLSRLAAAEAARVARAEGASLANPWGEVRKVLLATSGNRSSMLQDVEAHRRTELDAITGEIVRVGRKHGMDLPVNSGILRAVGAL